MDITQTVPECLSAPKLDGWWWWWWWVTPDPPVEQYWPLQKLITRSKLCFAPYFKNISGQIYIFSISKRSWPFTQQGDTAMSNTMGLTHRFKITQTWNQKASHCHPHCSTSSCMACPLPSCQTHTHPLMRWWHLYLHSVAKTRNCRFSPTKVYQDTRLMALVKQT